MDCPYTSLRCILGTSCERSASCWLRDKHAKEQREQARRFAFDSGQVKPEAVGRKPLVKVATTPDPVFCRSVAQKRPRTRAER